MAWKRTERGPAKTRARRKPAPAKGAMGAALVATLALTGCRHTPVTDIHSRFYTVPKGSIFNLRKEVTIPAQSAQIYIQDGRVRPSGPGFYYPHCKLSVNDISDRPQHIEPDEFVITDVARHTDCVVLVRRGPVQVAALGHVRLAGGGGDDGGPSDCRYYTEMRLHSDRRPQVRKLVCQQLDDPGLGWYVTFDEMRLTLSPIGGFTRPDGTPFPPPEKPAY